jgi:hypothetical protein
MLPDYSWGRTWATFEEQHGLKPRFFDTESSAKRSMGMWLKGVRQKIEVTEVGNPILGDIITSPRKGKYFTPAPHRIVSPESLGMEPRITEDVEVIQVSLYQVVVIDSLSDLMAELTNKDRKFPVA